MFKNIAQFVCVEMVSLEMLIRVVTKLDAELTVNAGQQKHALIKNVLILASTLNVA
jgi:hypothetical protein